MPVSRSASSPRWSFPAATVGVKAIFLGVSDEEELPLFPLSQVVLFPGVRCPLHIFEPRYRQMTEAALAGSRRIGMVTVRPEHTTEMAGDPPLFDVGCAGTIEMAQRLPDGRFSIVLAGAERFRVLHELPREGERLFRLGRVLHLDEKRGDAGRIAALRERTLSHVRALLRQAAPELGERLDAAGFAGQEDAGLVHGLCQLLQLPPAEKQGLLEANSLEERLERLEGLLAFARVEAAGGLPGRGGTVH